MRIVGFRWAEEDERISCGPVSGNTVVEVVVIDEDNTEPVYITVSAESGFERITVTLDSIFSEWFNYELGDKLGEHPYPGSLEDYELEKGDDPESIFCESKYRSAIEFARSAVLSRIFTDWQG